MPDSKQDSWGITLDDLKVKLEEKKWLLKIKQLQHQSELIPWDKTAGVNRQMDQVKAWKKKASANNKTEDELTADLQVDEQVLLDRIYWEEWYDVKERYSGADEWKFQPIDLADGLSDHVVKYIQSLYDNALPVPSMIFKRDPCLVWTRAKNEKGYAKHNPPKNASGSTLVHRYIFEAANYELGEATIDHACGKTDCINLRHLRPLDRELNRKYGDHRELDVNQYTK